MEKNYGWKLLRIDRIRSEEGGIFKYNCIFKGSTEFPNYLQEDNEN